MSNKTNAQDDFRLRPVLSSLVMRKGSRCKQMIRKGLFKEIARELGPEQGEEFSMWASEGKSVLASRNSMCKGPEERKRQCLLSGWVDGWMVGECLPSLFPLGVWMLNCFDGESQSFPLSKIIAFSHRRCRDLPLGIYNQEKSGADTLAPGHPSRTVQGYV